MYFTLIEFTGLTVLCSYLVYYYSGPSVSLHVKFWSVLTWVLNFGIALLVPQDLYQTLVNHNNPQFHQTQRFQQIGTQYLILYWTVYLLTWTIIPVLQQWQNSGDLKSIDRLKRSLKTNGIFYLYMIVGGIIGLVILILLHAGGDMGLLTYLKCLATSFGIFLLMLLMGYAMAQIPKALWEEANPQTHLTYLYKKINSDQDQLSRAQFEFKKIISFIQMTQKKITDNQQISNYCIESLNLVPIQMKSSFPQNYQQILSQPGYLADYPLGLESSIEHHRLLKRNLSQIRRLKYDINKHVCQAVFFQDVVESIKANTGKLQTKVISHPNSIHYYWYCIVRTIFKKLLAIMFTIASLIIIISQTQIFLTKQSSLLAYLLEVNNLQVLRILCLLVICFICYMVYYSLFRLKLSNIYGLYKGQSDGPSLMFATINFSRVGVAIVLNFFDMLKMQSIFSNIMATPDMGLLGNWVIKGMPGVLWLIVLTHFFNLWGKLMYYIGLDNMSFSSHDFVDDGKKLSPYQVRQYRQALQKQYSSNILQGRNDRHL